MDYASSIWRCWRFQPHECASLCAAVSAGELPYSFSSQKSLGLATGVKPELVEQLSTDAHSAAEHELYGGGPASASALTAAGVCRLATANISDMSSCTLGGAVSHRFTADCVLRSLELSSKLRPAVALQDVLSDSAGMMFGPHAFDLQQSLQDRTLQLPGVAVLRASKARLELLTMMWERPLSLFNVFRRYLAIDSSPQLGFNFLCCREDRYSWARSAGEIGRIECNPADTYETRVIPLTTIELGTASAITKAEKHANELLAESEDVDQFHEKALRSPRHHHRPGCWKGRRRHPAWHIAYAR